MEAEIEWYKEFRRIAREIVYTRQLNEAAIRQFDPEKDFGAELRELLDEVNNPESIRQDSVFDTSEITDAEELNDRLSEWQGVASQNLTREMEYHYEQFRSHAASSPSDLSDELGDSAGKLLSAMYRDMIIQGVPTQQGTTSDVEQHATTVIELCNSKIEDLEEEDIL